MSELLPCPFCGGTPRIGDKYEGAGQRPSMNYPEIVCDQCGLRTDFGKRGFHRMFIAWNARAESAELARLRAGNEELQTWKGEQQQALIKMSIACLNAGFNGDSVVEGVKWVCAENEQLRSDALHDRIMLRLANEAAIGYGAENERLREALGENA